MEAAFAKPTEQVLASFGVDANKGLTDDQVLASRTKHGKNGKLSESRVFSVDYLT
jgi:Ca2+ transporting ATPase